MYFKNVIPLLAAAPAVLAKVQFLGVAIAGGDFGCEIDGSCPIGSSQLPLNNDGIAQIKHFVEDDGINLLRLPISWQFLVNNKLGGSLDGANLAKYDQLVRACLDTGAHCMIDIHNFARWDGGIIGQGGPSDDQFVSLWQQLATKYAGEDKVIFELMNEPHDLDVGLWAQTCQKAVTAIREAGATKQTILLPGTNFDSAATLPGTGGGEALLAVTNPDGTTDNLLLDIHKYLDEDNSGTHAKCTTDNADAFTKLAQFLRERGRKGLVSETGASQDSSCLAAFCAQNALINKNSDVFVGLVGWGAGGFDTSYVLSLTPSKQNGRLVDNKLMSQCLIGQWVDSNSPTAANTTTKSSQSSPTLSQSSIFSPSTVSASTTASASATAASTAAFSPVSFSTSTKKPSTTDLPAASAGGADEQRTGTEEWTITLDKTSILPTAAVPSTLTMLLVATGTPTVQPASIALVEASSSSSAAPSASVSQAAPPASTSAPATAGAPSSSSPAALSLLLGCAAALSSLFL
ncbi:glycoside hydrolase family 5 protein [Durotheca rogersii]|uniref:glycoside hydrolase family 5 protein n=1 Tax=Durotheca rogersii TaxID=419775 RepID=UPI0022206607|nr:glycoside hydrolase family 5 protein [Durotheca rogersii]KAI5863334.1 glycoside hydrolase family 5 protein [Durotheca rogersii]